MQLMQWGNRGCVSWEGDHLAMELDQDFTPIRRYTYGIGKDSVEGHIEFSEASSNLFAHPYGWYSYIKDQVGTIYKVFSHQTQSTVTTRHYDTFGNLLSQSGPSKGNLGFQSKYYDQESGLNYFYHRYYHPNIGRFTTEDPNGLRYSPNLTRSFLNNPINVIDPMGLSDIIVKVIRTIQKKDRIIGRFYIEGSDINGRVTELPWRDNAKWVSCIPGGCYKLLLHNGGRHKNKWKLSFVEGRTDILIHKGFLPKHTQGCLLFTTEFNEFMGYTVMDLAETIMFGGDFSIEVQYMLEPDLMNSLSDWILCTSMK